MKLKMPQLKKPESGEKADSGASKFFSDLYRDLSDRHLLLPLIGLVIAIVAVPMLLSSSPEPTMPATAPATDTAGPTALDAAVVVSNPGIRDYKDRLAALKQKNPFAAAGGAGGSSGGNDGTTSSTTSGSGDSTGSTSSSTSSGSTPSTPSPSTGSTSTGSVSIDTGSDTGGTPTTPPADTTDPGTGSDTGSSPEDVKPETRFYASRIDVTVGPVGKAKEIDGVKQLDFLPDSKAPVVAYLGLVNDSSALFSVNPGVAETQGEGSCAPHGNSCMYLTLKVGEEQRFVYGDSDDAKIYRLKLLDARIVRVQDPRDRDAADNGGDPKRAHAPVDASSRTN